ncbi:hypothetical protein TNCV_1396661 [Trichonephila clavipes]|nr:hypothetical protein TNCV_1396661 [Trichonephila clavipes]
MQLLPGPAYSPDMSPIEHVRDFFGRRLARDPQLQKTNFCCAYKEYGILFDKQTFNCVMTDLLPRRIPTLIAARSGYTKY